MLAEIEMRNVAFHSWRHKLNTLLRAAGVPDAKIRLLTGHRSKEMTDWYTQFLHTDLTDVTAVQTRALAGNEVSLAGVLPEPEAEGK